MSQTPIKAVLFDLGETLILYGQVSRIRVFGQGARASYDFLKGQGQPLSPFPIYFLKNAARLRWQTLRSHWTGRDFDVLDLFQRVGARKGICLQPSHWERLAWQWYRPLAEVAVIEPGTSETLGSLQGMALKMGILSNTFVPASCLDRHLAELGLLDFLPVRLYSYEYRFRKPDPRFFRLAAERLGEPVEHILYVGDRIDWDVRPALRLGMHVVLKLAYTSAGRAVPSGARTIQHLAELPMLVSRINAG